MQSIELHEIHKPADMEIWRPLRHFNYYRSVLAILLLVLFYKQSLNGFLGQVDHESFLIVNLGFLFSSMVYIFLCFNRLLTLNWQVIIANFCDIGFIILLMHFSGGLGSGLGILLIVNIVATGTFLRRRESHLFASLATIGVLSEVTFNQLYGVANAGSYSIAGILGMVFFATSQLASMLSTQLRKSEALAEAQAADLINLEKLNDDIIQSMRTGILVVDTLGRIRLANDSAESLLGNIPLQNNPLLADVLPGLNQRWREWQTDPRMHHQAIRQQQGLPDIQPGFRQLDDARGHGGNTLIFLEDATQLNQRFQQMKLASLGRLTASIAHEIRNPLSAINHAAQLLRESPLDTGDKKLTQIINTQVQRLDKIVQNVLQLSRPQHNTLEPIELYKWLIKFREEFCAVHNLSETQIDIQANPGDIRVLFDTNHLRQVLDNLCSNALIHHNKPIHEIYLQLIAHHTVPDQPWLDVIDNGPGIHQDQVEQIFDPFFTTNPKGTGLGLFITKEIIESNRARIRYIAAPNGGSCFRISFLEAAPRV